MTQWTYKGWAISVDPKPIPSRSFDWSAVSPDYDCDEDSEYGPVITSGEVLYAATYEDLLAEIEDYLADCEPTYTLDQQIAEARSEMGEAKWHQLGKEWSSTNA